MQAKLKKKKKGEGEGRKIKERKREESCVHQLPAVLAENPCSWHLHYLFHFLKMRKRTMQLSILRAFVVIRLFTVCRIALLPCMSYFQGKPRKLYFVQLPFIDVYFLTWYLESSPSCFLLMGFCNLHSYCCTTSLGRQDFCGCVLSRDSIGSRDILHIENSYLCHAVICCMEETLLNPENNILNFVLRTRCP